ncbi:hypothetical protein ACCAA_170004 [Candidatus Accumulibacter aalborgensis]|uniref:PAS domain-containing protein n=1 Tax=Candidatus Accumulibacter aalborgensis TaxID=1860102 RepID=A0A1A8XJP4_9PROT|nr:hypothetical protein ACCAA_170004 [Candidatus Accumulibacter aalborgensis]
MQGAFAQLSRKGFAGGSLDETLRQLTAATGRILDIERASLWGLTAQRATLECIDLYELSRNRHSSGVTLHAAHYPEYFRALARGEPIVADNALVHPCTQEFADHYLLMNGISAVINSPIHVNGDLQGVLCIERVGPHSAWTSMQRLFAQAIASLVSLALLQSQLVVVEGELRDANNLRRALFTGARDAIVISDGHTGHILDANPQAERLFGRRVQQLLGVLQSELHAAGDDRQVRELCTLRGKAEKGEAVRGEVVNGDGRLVPVEMTGQVVQLEQGKKIFQGVFRPLDRPV